MRLTIVERTTPTAAGAVLSIFIINRIGVPADYSFTVFLYSLIISILLLIVSLWMSARGTAISIFLFCFGISAALTAQSGGLLMAGTAYTGIPVSTVQSVDVLLSSDPQRLPGGLWVSGGRLKTVYRRDISCRARGRITIFGRGEHDCLGTGMNITLTGTLQHEENDERAVKVYGYVFFSDEYTCNDWENRIYKKRQYWAGAMERKLFSGSYSSGVLMSALLLGQRGDSDSLLIRYFRESGCMHILALSGLHVGLIAFALRALLKPLTGFTAASLISAAAVVAFLLFVGFRPSLFRAVAMYLLYTGDSLRGYRVNPLKYLSAVFVAQSLLFPLSVYSLSFSLSYTALFGLLMSGSAYFLLLYRYLPMKLSSALGAGLGAQFATLPLVTASFGVWYPIGIIAAPLLTIFSSALMALGSLRLLFPLNSMIGIYISGIIDHLVNLIIGTAELSARVPGFKITEYLSWLIALTGTILPLILIRSIRRGHSPSYQSRFPILHKGISGQPGTGPAKEMGAEFPYKSRSPEKNNLIPGN